MQKVNISGTGTLTALEAHLVMTLLANALRRAVRWGSSAVGIACLWITTASGAPSALDGFDPNANSSVRIAVVRSDGKILIGGDFTSLAPNGGVSVTRNHLARLNPDGSLDAAFNPNANTNVHSIAVQADGQALAGGAFTSIGGQTRTNLARLAPTTGTADSFNPNANGGVVNAIVVQSDRRILAGGSFTNIGGQTRNNIARLEAMTGLADSFNPNANNTVSSIAVQADGKVLVSGYFTRIGEWQWGQIYILYTWLNTPRPERERWANCRQYRSDPTDRTLPARVHLRARIDSFDTP